MGYRHHVADFDLIWCYISLEILPKWHFGRRNVVELRHDTPADMPCFTQPERALLRHKFFVHFGRVPLLAHGIRLRS